MPNLIPPSKMHRRSKHKIRCTTCNRYSSPYLPCLPIQVKEIDVSKHIHIHMYTTLLFVCVNRTACYTNLFITKGWRCSRRDPIILIIFHGDDDGMTTVTILFLEAHAEFLQLHRSPTLCAGRPSTHASRQPQCPNGYLVQCQRGQA